MAEKRKPQTSWEVQEHRLEKRPSSTLQELRKAMHGKKVKDT